MTQLGAPPAGWYVDPSGRHRARYWDGSSWTTHVTDDISSDDALRPPPGVAVGGAPVAVDPPATEAPEYVSAAAETTAGIAGAVAAIVAGDTAEAGQPAAGWYPDPTGRHEVRFWDGLQWTGRVATEGLEAIEPVGEPMYGIATASLTTATDGLPPLRTLDTDADPSSDDQGRRRRGRRKRTRRSRAGGDDNAGPGTVETKQIGARAGTSVASRIAGVFVLVGAAALLLGSTMAWVSVSGTRLAEESTISGLDGDGRVTAVIAFVLGLFGLGMVTGRFVKIGGIRIGAMAVLVAGAAALAICGLNMADVIDRAPRLGIEAGATADFGKGLWVAFAGVTTAVAGGLLAFTNRTGDG